jgi:membrane protease YdiL (CAAX protease family)
VTRLRALYERAVAGPGYPPDEKDLSEFRLVGVELPVRATVAVLAATALLVVDHLDWLLQAGTGAGLGDGLRAVSVERFVLFLVVPAGIVLLGFRDGLGRYGLRPGDWRWGLGLLLLGVAVMTPIILALSGVPAFRSFYGSAPRPVSVVFADGLVELIPAEFLLRGFLMFTLWRRIGALAIVVVQVPFVLTHFGKPDIELWSTFIGGTVFAWLDWRTGSILWSALGHVYVLTLMLLAVGGATL